MTVSPSCIMAVTADLPFTAWLMTCLRTAILMAMWAATWPVQRESSLFPTRGEFWCKMMQEMQDDLWWNIWLCFLELASEDSFSDDANLAGEPLKCPGGYHTGEQRTKQSLMMVINNFGKECPCGEDECPIGECECNGQLRIRSDCKYARSEGGTFNYSEELNDLDVAMTPQIWDTLNIIVTKDDIIRTLNYLR